MFSYFQNFLLWNNLHPSVCEVVSIAIIAFSYFYLFRRQKVLQGKLLIISTLIISFFLVLVSFYVPVNPEWENISPNTIKITNFKNLSIGEYSHLKVKHRLLFEVDSYIKNSL